MANVKTSSPKKSTRKIKPALTPEGRENLCIDLAMDLVQQRLLNGTASSQEVTHFLKLGSTRAKLELKTLESQSKLYEAKAEAIADEKNNKQLYKDAIAAMRRYSGHGTSDDEDQDIY